MGSLVSIPAPTSPQFGTMIKQLIEMREGVRGNALDRFVSVRDLIDADFVNSLAKYGPSIASADPNGYVGKTAVAPPVSFTVSGGTFRAILSWAASTSTRVYYYEIRIAEVAAGSAAPTLADYTRTIIVTHPVSSCTDSGLDPASTDYYYWIRAVDFTGNNFSAWVAADILTEFIVRNTIDHVLEMLRGGNPPNYAPGTTYYEDDQVYYVTNGRTYIVTDDNGGAGITGVAPTDTDHWARHGILLVGDVDGDSMVGIDGGLVVDGTIYGRSVVAETITASHINGSGFGTLTLTSGKIYINTTDGIEIGGGGNINVLQGGDIIFNTDSSAALLTFTGASGIVGLMYAASDSTTNITPGNTRAVRNLSLGVIGGADDYRWENITLSAATYIYVDGDIRPSAGHSCGIAAEHWNYVYADNYYGIADLYWLDSRISLNGEVVAIDDLEVLKNIKPSGGYDELTGLPLISDSSLPPWIVHKHPKSGELRDDNGDIIQSWKRGDVAVDKHGRPYVSPFTLISLLRGAIVQLDKRIDGLLNQKESEPINERTGTTI
jgi:hypothetical protein